MESGSDREFSRLSSGCHGSTSRSQLVAVATSLNSFFQRHSNTPIDVCFNVNSIQSWSNQKVPPRAKRNCNLDAALIVSTFQSRISFKSIITPFIEAELNRHCHHQTGENRVVCVSLHVPLEQNSVGRDQINNNKRSSKKKFNGKER